MKQYKIENLKSIDEYKKELIELHNELGVGIATDTLIKDDLKMLTRIDELIVIIEFLKNNGAKWKNIKQ